MSRYQKTKTNLDFTEARDSEWQWHQLGHMQVCISLQTDNHASTPPLVFLQAGWPSCRPTNSVKALKAKKSDISYYRRNCTTEVQIIRVIMSLWAPPALPGLPMASYATGQTDTIPFHRPCSAYFYAGSAKQPIIGCIVNVSRSW